ncbi:hypothetical protein AX15_007011 [Amanita polypyramis BW_CC]|nr:hypothetical protein AX15_007011 [Amanita polypyramis BW_CC]
MPDSPLNDDHIPASPLPAPAPSPASLAHSSNAQLAALLADALKETESLRRELALTKKRADDVERRYHALSSISDSKGPLADASRAIQEFEQRALDAEAARDDSDSRRRLVVDTWHQLDRYLQTVEMRAADARAGFAKIVAEGGGHLVFNAIPLPGGGPVQIPYPPLGAMPPPNHARAPYPATGRPSPLGHRSAQSQSSFPPLALPPHPTPNSNGRRPREESLDRAGYVDTLPGQPPSKKLKGFGDDRRGRDERAAYSESNLAYLHQRHQPLPPQAIEARERIYQERRLPQARMIVPPAGGGDPELANHRGRSRSRSRSSSRSSRSSLSVDEMLLEAANGNGAPGSAGDAASQRSHRRRHQHSHKEDLAAGSQRHPLSNEPTLHTIQQQLPHPPSQRTHADSPPPQQLVHNYRPRAPHASASVPLVAENHVGTMPAACHVQTIQTHVFAPVVTGAPQKKNKFSASSSVGNLGSVDAPPPTPQHVFPAMNNQGQRICRQCGMPGRYKDGKCVEKWGPGPMGPGTVCDR